MKTWLLMWSKIDQRAQDSLQLAISYFHSHDGFLMKALLSSCGILTEHLVGWEWLDKRGSNSWSPTVDVTKSPPTSPKLSARRRVLGLTEMARSGDCDLGMIESRSAGEASGIALLGLIMLLSSPWNTISLRWTRPFKVKRKSRRRRGQREPWKVIGISWPQEKDDDNLVKPRLGETKL